MKICMLSHAFAPDKLGGAEIYAENIAKVLAKNHEVIIITPKAFRGMKSLFSEISRKNNIKFYKFYPLNIFSIYNTQKKSLFLKGLWRILDLFSIHTSIKIINIIAKEKPDIIHIHILHGLSPIFTLKLIQYLKIPTVITLHTYGFFCLRCDYLKQGKEICTKKNLFCKIFAKLMRFVTGRLPNVLISPSEFCFDIYKENGIFRNSKQFIIPNGVDIHAPRTEKNKPENKDFAILYAGRLVQNKGIHILIKAFLLLDFHFIKLIICGEGNYQKTLQNISNDKRIIFTGKISKETLIDFYYQSSITVLPSLFCETFGQVITESFSSGIPVIGSRIGAIPEIIQEGFNGYLFNPGDFKELSRILSYLINNPAKLTLLRQNASKTAEKYSMKNHIARLETIYTEAINARA